jgi:dUTP pyrophosphatase
MHTILVKYFDPDLIRLEKTEKGDWIDLRSRIDISYKKDEYILLPLGIALEIPEGYESVIFPRSSTFKNWGVTMIAGGLIDNSYKGDNDEWFVPLYALRDGTIQKNDRIVQFRIQKKMDTVEFSEVASLENENRGGYGSSGKR